MTDIQQEAGMCARCWGKAFTAAYGIGSKTQAGEYERIVASCACTPAQRYGVADSFAAGYTARDKEIEELRARVKELSALVCYTTFHHGYYSYEPPETRNESFYFTPSGVGGGGVEHKLPAKYQEAARLAREALMVPPIPLPEADR